MLQEACSGLVCKEACGRGARPPVTFARAEDAKQPTNRRAMGYCKMVSKLRLKRQSNLV